MREPLSYRTIPKYRAWSETFTQLSNNRGQELTAFLATTQRLRREQAAAQSASQTVSQKASALQERKATVEKAIAKQKGLLRKAGEPTTGRGPKIGGTYNGPGGPVSSLRRCGPSRRAPSGGAC